MYYHQTSNNAEDFLINMCIIQKISADVQQVGGNVEHSLYNTT